ncbi:MAG: RnfABCDGE type electron transport complex subunit D [Lachnospiraceae bacterium]|nr:RnfABCDGE type electron transport complex subunit D [Lachnospiraceae bacterium]
MDEKELNLKISASPHVRSDATTADIMSDVMIALVPATAFGVYLFGMHAALLVLACVVSAVLAEFIYEKMFKLPVTIGDFSAVVTGLLLAMNLPPELPIWMGVLGSVFAIIVVKQLFGGLGKNFMNPALAARCFLLLSFGASMTRFVYDGVTTATPLALLKNGSSVNLKDMFLGFTGGTIGETSALALLIGACYLLIKRVISPKIPLVYIGTFAIAMTIYAVVKDKDVVNFVLCEICGGGLMLGAWFMATDYVTSPITPVGKIIYGIILGLLTFVLRIFGNGAEGVSYAIIMSNILVPLIEMATKPKAFGEGAELSEEDKKKKKDEKNEDKNVGANDAQKEENSSKEPKDVKGIMKAICAIMLITVIMGAILGAVYSITKDPISKAEEKAKQEAYKEVFPEAVEIVTDETIDYKQINEIIKSFGYTHDTIDEISFATDGAGNVIGYIVVVTNDNGYGGDIQMVVGMKTDTTITGLAFLTLDESPGLGMEADKPKFKDQFIGKHEKSYEYSKTGAVKENQIDAISGATITTSAVTDGVNAAVAIINISGGE